MVGTHQPRQEARSRMWQSMRILRHFTVPDLVATATVKEARAYVYVQALAAHGYVKCLHPHKPGPGSSMPALWQLVRDTGPFAPRRARGKFLDPNLDDRRRATHVQVLREEYERALKCVRACAGMDDPETEVARLKRLAEGASL